MPKTPAKKKSVKVTQPDPKAKGGAILDARNRAMEEERLRVMRIIEPLTLRVTVLESTVLDLYARLPALEPKEPEPWVPKVGDYIYLTSGHSASIFHNTVVKVKGMVASFDHPKSATGGSALPTMYRRATQAEIDAHLEAEAKKKQEEEWALVSELQEGDACEEDFRAVMQECVNIGVPVCPVGSDIRFAQGVSFHASLVNDDFPSGIAYYVKQSDRSASVNKYPKAEFLRRAKGTAARMEHEWPLVEAAQAVVDRWDTPLWKDVGHTGSFIGRLRDALSHYTKPIER